uniref:Uncharacterized protein n=1 Tax=Melopsittacus undulatus TaxID=13146 RepID=A0A8V5GBK4_MELUD
MSFENNVASFRIEPVSKEDSGTYSFKVENDFGSSTCEAVLTVLGLYCHLANSLIQQGGNEKIIISVKDRQEGNQCKLTKKDTVLGSSIQMECKVSGSLPITAKWYKDGKEITDSAKYRSLCHENTMSLEIANLELADSANYTCSISNVAGSDSCSAVLTVKGKVLTHMPSASENTKIMFMENIATLQLLRTETSSAGKYICQIRNDAGSRECMATLSILGW